MPLYGTKPCDPANVQCRMNLDNNRAQIKRQRDSETRAAWSAPSSATWTSNRVSDKPSLKRTAWHEAGHAVVAWEQGLTVTHVSIRPEGESIERSTHSPAGDCTIESERYRENIVAMGGWAAELASGEVGDDNWTYDCGDCPLFLKPDIRQRA